MATNLLTLAGGAIIIVAGVILSIAGAALGLQAAWPTVPQWVFFLGVGVFSLLLGAGLLYWGKERTVTSVENTLTMKQSFKDRPFLMVAILAGVGLLAGIIVKRVSSSRREYAKAKEQVAAFTDTQVEELMAEKKPWWQRKVQQLALSAATSVLAIGFRTYGVPLLQQWLAKYSSGDKSDAPYDHRNGTAAPEEDRYAYYNNARR